MMSRSCFASRHVAAQQRAAKALGHGAHQHRVLRVEAVGELRQLLHRGADRLHRRHRIAAIARGHRLAQPRLHGGNHRPRRVAEQRLELLEPGDEILERGGNARSMLVGHAAQSTERRERRGKGRGLRTSSRHPSSRCGAPPSEHGRRTRPLNPAPLDPILAPCSSSSSATTRATRRRSGPLHRPAHLAHLEPLAQAGRVILAGPLTDGAGSLIVVEADSLGAVWELVGRDPYVTNGIFERVEVHPFMRVFPRAE